MKKQWQTPELTTVPVDLTELGDGSGLSDAELKLRLEQAGFPFGKKYQASPDYIRRSVGDADVLISVGANIANFNGYIELNPSAADLWERLQTPSTLGDLEQTLEGKYGIAHETAVQDVLDFVRLLMEHDMVAVM